MTTSRRVPTRFLVRASWVAVVAACAVMIDSMRRALRVPDVRPVPAATPDVREGPSSLRSVVTTDTTALLEHDPFRVTRDRPARRYELPRGRLADAPANPSGSTFVLNGTVSYGAGRGVAILALDSDSTVMIRVGERLYDYTLTRVERDRAVLAGADGTELVLARGEGGSQ